MKTRNSDLTATVETHRDKLESFIERRVRDQKEAEDVFQDVVEEYFESYDLNEAIESLGSWLLKVAQNKILDRFRRRRTRQDFQNTVLQSGEGEAFTESTPEDECTRALIRQEIAAAIEELPEEQRLVFVRHELEGKSFDEISAETGVSMNTLLARKRYAVQFLRDYLKEIYDELE